MHRRALLAALAGGLAGCAGNGSTTPTPTRTPTSPPTATPTPTASPTASPTPTPTAAPVETPAQRPTILIAQVATGWQSFGDLAANAIKTVTVGDAIVAGAQFELAIHDGSVRYTLQIEIDGPDGDRVALATPQADRLVDDEGRTKWEHVTGVATTEWTPGEYTLRVLVRDDVLEAVSDEREEEFTVVAG
jgi:hypothetical protein